jgi:hypothetical protein
VRPPGRPPRPRTPSATSPSRCSSTVARPRPRPRGSTSRGATGSVRDIGAARGTWACRGLAPAGHGAAGRWRGSSAAGELAPGERHAGLVLGRAADPVAEDGASRVRRRPRRGDRPGPDRAPGSGSTPNRPRPRQGVGYRCSRCASRATSAWTAGSATKPTAPCRVVAGAGPHPRGARERGGGRPPAGWVDLRRPVRWGTAARGRSRVSAHRVGVGRGSPGRAIMPDRGSRGGALAHLPDLGDAGGTDRPYRGHAPGLAPLRPCRSPEAEMPRPCTGGARRVARLERAGQPVVASTSAAARSPPTRAAGTSGCRAPRSAPRRGADEKLAKAHGVAPSRRSPGPPGPPGPPGVRWVRDASDHPTPTTDAPRGVRRARAHHFGAGRGRMAAVRDLDTVGRCPPGGGGRHGRRAGAAGRSRRSPSSRKEAALITDPHRPIDCRRCPR